MLKLMGKKIFTILSSKILFIETYVDRYTSIPVELSTLLFQVDNFINETRLKIYSLLSGQLVLSSPASLVNTCEGLDWKRSLALHLW